MFKFHTVILFFFLCSLSFHTLARLELPSEARYEIVSLRKEIRVHKDGTYEQTTEIEVKILNESGRTNNFMSAPFVYENGDQTLEVLEARTINQEQTFDVKKDDIEDKAVGSSMRGFSNYHQVLISFPNVQIGSILFLKLKRTILNPYFKDSFFHDTCFDDILTNSSRLIIESDIPLFFEIHDPYHVLQTETSLDSQGLQKFEVSLKKPVMTVVVEESNALINPKIKTWFMVTSLSNWNGLVDMMAPIYEKVASQPLPELFQIIASKAKEKRDLLEKINTVTILLNEAVHYRGDWRSISGKFYPRDLDLIAKEKRADCKDFSISTVAILRSIGIDAYSALVLRGGVYESLPSNQPTPNRFNHAIVMVKTNDKVLWIDPTNFASNAGKLFPDIAGKDALPLILHTGLDKIPSIQPEDSGLAITKEFKFLPNGLNEVNGQIIFQGADAIRLTGIELRRSKESIEYILMNLLDDINQVQSSTFQGSHLTSRVVSDIEFQFSYQINDSRIMTNAGTAFKLQILDFVCDFPINSVRRFSDLQIDHHPFTYRQITSLKNMTAKKVSKLSCDLKSPWLDFHRKLKSKKRGIEIIDLAILKRNFVTAEEIASKEFSDFQTNLKHCIFQKAILLDE